MNKLTYIAKILKDRWLRPYDEIVIRFNTKAKPESPLVWRIFINGQEHLASGFEIQGYVYDIISHENDIKKYNVGCMGRVRWNGTFADIYAAKKEHVPF